MKRGKLIAVATLCILAAASLAWASGGEAAAHGGHHYNWMDLVWRTINFALVFGVIWFLAGKKLSGGLKGRSTDIANQLSDLEARKAEAEKKLRGIESSISNLEAEKKQITEEYHKQGEALKASIIAAAEEKAASIKEQAKLTAEQEGRAAAQQLRAEMADLVVEVSERMLKEKLSAGDQEKLVDEYLTKVVLN